MFTDLAFQFLIDCHYLFFSEVNHNYENTTIRDAVKLVYIGIDYVGISLTQKIRLISGCEAVTQNKIFVIQLIKILIKTPH